MISLTRKIAWQCVQPLLKPLGRLSTNHLWLILTPSESLNHIITTLWTPISKGWTHGTRATCVAWFLTKGTEAPSSSTNLSLGTWKLTSTKWSARNSPPSLGIHLQMGLNPIEAKWSARNSPPSWGIHLQMGLNPVEFKPSLWNFSLSWQMHVQMVFESRWNWMLHWVWIPFNFLGVFETLHSAGEWIFESPVGIPLMLSSGARETLHRSSWELHQSLQIWMFCSTWVK